MPESLGVPPTKLWLIRHGEPDVSVRDRCYGSLDVGLSAGGERQIEAVAARLSGEPFNAIYTSPRLRCRQSAAILAAIHNCAVEPVEALSEIDFGEFEGCTYDEIATRYPEIYQKWMEHPTETQFPGGESYSTMWTRVVETAAVLRARHSGQCLLLVTHAGVIRILLAESLTLPPTEIFRIAQSYAAVNLISYFDGFPIVELMNCFCI